MKFVLAVFIFFGESSFAIKPEALLDLPSMSISTDKGSESIRVGDRLRATLTGSVSVESGDSLSLEVPEGTSSLIEQGFFLEPLEFDSTQRQIVLTFAPIRDGELSLAPMALKKGNDVVGRTEIFKITVGPPVASNDPKAGERPADYYPPVVLQFPWKFIALWAVVVLALVVVAAWLVIRSLRRRHRPQVSTVVEPPAKTEDILALNQLAQLEAERLLEKEQFKKHYFGVSDILKTYLGARYRIEALECTSEELCQLLKRCGVSSENVDRISRFFEELDVVKFTDSKPQLSVASRIVDKAREIIRLTRNVKVGTVGSYEIR